MTAMMPWLGLGLLLLAGLGVVLTGIPAAVVLLATACFGVAIGGISGAASVQLLGVLPERLINLLENDLLSRSQLRDNRHQQPWIERVHLGAGEGQLGPRFAQGKLLGFNPATGVLCLQADSPSSNDTVTSPVGVIPSLKLVKPCMSQNRIVI